MCDNVVVQHDGEQEREDVEPPAKRKAITFPKPSSHAKCWQYFEKTVNAQGKTTARCKLCLKTL